MTIGTHPGWLFELLPANHREEDARLGGPLERLLALIEAQADALDADIARLGDDFFVETAQRWVLPYIGDLVGNELLHAADRESEGETATARFRDLIGPTLHPPPAIRTRADVAKTIYYRRRKGTLPMLEELARDVTGWSAHAVEFFELLRWTQQLEHLRPHAPGTTLLRSPEVAGRAHGAFDMHAHTVDVRRLTSSSGWHNLKHLGLFLWRLRSQPLQHIDARAGALPWQWRASVLGDDAPLFARWRREGDETGLATELHVPGPIRPAAFHADLDRAHAALAPTHSDFYGHAASYDEWSVGVTVGGLAVPVGLVRCQNLDPWVQPAAGEVAIDVRRGRIALGTSWVGSGPVLVSLHRGFSADMGGGSYDRARWLVQPALASRHYTVSADVATAAGFTSIGAALAQWVADGRRDAIVRILDSHTYTEPIAIDPAPGGWLVIQADDRQRPHLRPPGGAIVVGPTGGHGAELTLSGLLVEGGVEVTGELGRLRLLHTTLVPGRALTVKGAPAGIAPSIDAVSTIGGRPANAGLRVELAFSIVGPLRLPEHATELLVLDSIVDGLPRAGGTAALCATGTTAGDGPPLHVERSTLFGPVYVRELPYASESIVTGEVRAARQAGCVRFSYVPPSSVTPRQYRCQPRLATDADPARAPEIEQALVPSFTAMDYGRPGYAQLRTVVPAEIRRGAEDESEMGVFCHLKQPQREANLRVRLREYLPVGLEAAPIPVT